MGPVHRQITRTISIKYQTICCRTLEILICCFILLPVLVFGAQTQRQHAWKKCWQNCLAEHVGRFLCQPSLPAMLAPALAKGFCAHVAWSVKHSMALSIYIYILYTPISPYRMDEAEQHRQKGKPRVSISEIITLHVHVEDLLSSDIASSV